MRFLVGLLRGLDAAGGGLQVEDTRHSTDSASFQGSRHETCLVGCLERMRRKNHDKCRRTKTLKRTSARIAT